MTIYCYITRIKEEENEKQDGELMLRCDDGNQYLRNQLGNKQIRQQSMIDHNKKRSYNEVKERGGEEKCPQEKEELECHVCGKKTSG